MMRPTRISVLLVYFFLFTSFLAIGTKRFSQLTIRDGLSQSSIKSIFQDSKGFMWFGSADGLNRYDGYKLIVYRNDPSNPMSLSGNDIKCIYENQADSSLWIGTQGEGLNLYDRKHNAFISFKHNDKDRTSLPSNNVNSILTGFDGRLWIGTDGGGICSYNPADSTFLQPDFCKLSQYRIIYSLATDEKGILWMGTNNGLYHFNTKGGNIPVKVDLGPESSANILSLLFDVKGYLWVGTRKHGLIKFRPETGKISRYQITGSKLSAEYLCAINDIHQRKDGSIWIATESGLARYNSPADKLDFFRNSPEDAESISDDLIYSVFEDRSGMLWMGTFLGGVNMLNPEDSEFKKYNNFDKIFKLNKVANNVLGICCDRKNTVWITTSQGLISFKEGFFENEESPTEAELFFRNISQGNIFGDSRDNIYLSNSLGIYVLRNGASQFEKFDPVNMESYPLFKGFNSGFEDSERAIWFLTYFGLMKYDQVTKRLSLKNPKNSQGVEIRLNFQAVAEGYNGDFWLGTVNGIVYRYERNTDRFEQVIPSGEFQNSSTFNQIFSICEQSPGIVWFGTNNGLFEYNVKAKTLNRFMSSDGLSNNVVYSVVPDKKGRIWCSTNLGISVFNTTNRTFLNYSWEDGLQSNEFNQNAWYEATDGRIYMGGIDGFNVIDPDRISPNQFIAPVVITGLTVNHERVTPFSHPEITISEISEVEGITLSHDQAIFTMEFTALNYILPMKNQYRYKLEGYDKNWVEAGNQRTASYTNIDSGTYTFMVQGSNNDRVWNEKPTTLKIIILPPFWLTWWFKSLFLLFVLLIIYLVFYFRLRSIKQEQVRLAQLVEEKTADLSKKSLQIELQNNELVHRNKEIVSRNEKIEQKNKRLKEQNEQIAKQRDNLLSLAEQVQQANQAKINFFTTISHEFRTPLTLIIGPLKELITGIDKLDRNELHRKFKIIYGNASKLLLLVNELLDFRKADTDNIGLECSRLDLVPFIQQIAFLFNDIAQRKRIDFRFVSNQKTMEVWADAEKLEKIVSNLISNAFKFTPDHGNITVMLDSITGTGDNDQFQIVVSDSGKGISEDHIGYVFDTFYQADHTENLQQSGSGLGLALVKKYVELHGGIVSVTSKPGVGTSFVLTIPILAEEDRSHKSSIDFSHQLLSNRDVLIASIDDYSPNLLQNLKTGEEQNLPKLLLVEDDPALRAYLKEILLANYRVEEAGDATIGLELTSSRHPDLIISDAMLPGISGFDFCKRVKDEFKTSHIPVILLTALADLPNQINALKSGADAYITKPFDLQHLYLTVENLINQRRKLHLKYHRGISFDDSNVIYSKEDQQFMDKVIAEIEKNITDTSFDVERLCKEINLSQPQTYRKIKSMTELSISEFIRNIRLKKAAHLLVAENKTISEVAYEVGFSDPNYFSKCFVKVYGQTPSEFIKMKN